MPAALVPADVTETDTVIAANSVFLMWHLSFSLLHVCGAARRRAHALTSPRLVALALMCLASTALPVTDGSLGRLESSELFADVIACKAAVCASASRSAMAVAQS